MLASLRWLVALTVLASAVALAVARTDWSRRAAPTRPYTHLVSAPSEPTHIDGSST